MVFESGEKPACLAGRTPSQRAWQSFLSQQARENPILVAERFLEQSRLPSFQTYAQVAAHFGVSRVMVSYHIALVTRLPAAFISWLRQVDDPGILRHFTERRLRPMTRIMDKGQQRVLLMELLCEAGVHSEHLVFS